MAVQQSYRGSGEATGGWRVTPATGTARVNVGPTERLLSVAAGAALTYLGLRSRSQVGKPVLATLGSSLVLRGASGYCPMNQLFGRDSAEAQPAPIEIQETFVIQRPVEEVYAFWRRLENLPQFMHHLRTVRQLDQRRSHWEAQIPGGLGSINWESEILADEPNRLLVYQSLPGSQFDQSGEVRFRGLDDGKATEFQAIISYRAPLGALGQGVARLFNPLLDELVRRDVQRFKNLMETGQPAQKTK